MHALQYMQLIQLLDIFPTFFRAFYLPNGTLIYDLTEIRLHYTAHRLLWDLIAFVPFDFILSMYAATHHRFAGFIRVPRMLAVYTVWFKRGHRFKFGSDSSMASAILRLMACIAVITHIFACIWWLIGSVHMLDVRFALPFNFEFEFLFRKIRGDLIRYKKSSFLAFKQK
jgi:hypothetical protein